MSTKRVFMQLQDEESSRVSITVTPTSSLSDLVEQFHSKAFARNSIQTLQQDRPQLILQTPTPDTRKPVLADPTQLQEDDLIAYTPTDHVEKQLQCITPVQKQAALASERPKLKRKDRSVGGRLRAISNLAREGQILGEQKAILKDMAVVGDKNLEDAMEKFQETQDTSSFQDALRGAKLSRSCAEEVPFVHRMSIDRLFVDRLSTTLSSIDLFNDLEFPSSPKAQAKTQPEEQLEAMGDTDMNFLNLHRDVYSLPTESTPPAPPTAPKLKSSKPTRPALPMPGSGNLNDGVSNFIRTLCPSIPEKAPAPARPHLDSEKVDTSKGIRQRPGLSLTEPTLPKPAYDSLLMHLGSYGNADDFYSEYDVLEKIGHGTSAHVYKGKKKSSGEMFAVKIIDKCLVPEVKFLKREIEITCKVEHPRAVQVINMFEDADQLFLVMELCQLELFSFLEDNGPLDEELSRQMISNLLSIVAHLHEKGIVHRDIKPENILVVDKSDMSNIKLTDFGIARQLHEGAGNRLNIASPEALQPRLHRALTKCGTRDYIAPEIMRGKGYGTQVDLWSVGIVTFVLLSGFVPNYHFSPSGELQVSFESSCWDNTSSRAKDFISKLLRRDAQERLTAAQALRHPWVQFDVQLDETTVQT